MAKNNIAVDKGLMQGTNKGFEPKASLNRASVCVLLKRVVDQFSDSFEKVTF